MSALVQPIQGVQPYPAGYITVTLGGTYLLSSFVQPKPFYTAQNVAVLIPKREMTFEEKVYYCLCIEKNRFRYSAFGREANRTLKNILVPDDVPSWVSKVKKHDVISEKSLVNEKIALNSLPNKWFTYEELFTIERGKGPRKKDLKSVGNTPFVTSINSNNGWTGLTDAIPVHKGNTIGVNRNGSVGEAFYQPIPFCSTEDVHIFNAKFPLNKYIAMYLISLIGKESYRYNYGRKWGITRMNNSKIRLPITANGSVDWGNIEKYIKSLPYSASL